MKKVCILIHGYLTDYEDFCSLPQALMPWYDYVVLLHLPGHGREADLNLFSVQSTFDVVEQTVKDALEWGEVDIIGFSMGGALAQYIAIKYPIHKVVLLAPAIQFLNLLYFHPRIKYYFEQTKGQDEMYRKNMYRRIAQSSKDAWQFVLENTFPKFNFKNGMTFCRVIFKIGQVKGKIACPTCIIWGAFDELVPYVAIKNCYHKCIHEQKQVHIIPDVGHMLLRTNREQEIISIIKTFLMGE